MNKEKMNGRSYGSGGTDPVESGDFRENAWSISVTDLARLGPENMPEELISGKHLIYSSPATLAFNSPGAQGFGVKRAALAIPGSVMLLVAPGCCSRNTTIYSELSGYENRFFYLLMDETDIVTGRHLKKIPAAVEEICDSLKPRPSVVMICITCVDALLGTDMERVCRRASDKAGVPVLPSYMYALTREGRKPPMVHVRQSIYSLLEKRKRRGTSVNLLGFFASLMEDCELYDLLRQIGVKKIREIARCRDFEDYQDMAEANFNLVLNPEARYAASDISRRLGIPYIELSRLYQLDKIRRQYSLLAAALGASFEDQAYYDEAAAAIEAFKKCYPNLTFSVGEGCNANAYELSLALIRYGFQVAEIFADPREGDFIYIEKIASLSPGTRIYSNLEPTMLYYDSEGSRTDITVGRDAATYHPEAAHLEWCHDIQPFGYRGVKAFFEACEEILQEHESRERSFSKNQLLEKKSSENQLLENDSSENQSGKKKTPDLSGSSGFELISRESQPFSPEQMSEAKAGRKNKRLFKYISPFASDQSGAASVLCELGGMVIILDAGGCVGNICGFDEPRWFGTRSAIFSAGLRDMDAILGRDDRLVEKVEKAAGKLDCSFIAVIGTPVPSVIGTDYQALKRMIEKKTGLPVITVDSNGRELYDEGIRKAYEAVFAALFPAETFDGTPSEPSEAAGKSAGKTSCAGESYTWSKGSNPSLDKSILGILGATPLDLVVSPGSWAGSGEPGEIDDFGISNMTVSDNIRKSAGLISLDIINYYLGKGYEEVLCYGLGSGLETVKRAGKARKNVVIAPSALPAARYLKRNLGIPYEIHYPLETLPAWPEIVRLTEEDKPGRILIVHQQVLAHVLRNYIRAHLEVQVTAASWFDMDEELTREGDIRLKTEDQWIRLVRDGHYDLIIGDISFKKAVPDYQGAWINLEHFAVSGRR